MNTWRSGASRPDASTATASTTTAIPTSAPTTSSQNPPFNVSRLGRRAAAGRPALRSTQRPAGGQRELRLGAGTSCTTSPPRLRRLRPRTTARCTSNSSRCEARRYERTSSRRTSWIASSRSPRATLPLDPNTRLPVVRCRRAGAPASTGTARARCCSSTPDAMGRMTDRTHRELTTEDIARIARHLPRLKRGEEGAGEYADVPGFCKSVGHRGGAAASGDVLTPGRYVECGAAVRTTASRSRRSMTRLAAQLARAACRGGSKLRRGDRGKPAQPGASLWTAECMNHGLHSTEHRGSRGAAGGGGSGAQS